MNSRACRVLDHDPKSLCLLRTKVTERAQRGFWTCQEHFFASKLLSKILHLKNKRVLTLGQDPRPNGLDVPVPRAQGISINQRGIKEKINEIFVQ